jgi:hypothetical protein
MVSINVPLEDNVIIHKKRKACRTSAHLPLRLAPQRRAQVSPPKRFSLIKEKLPPHGLISSTFPNRAQLLCVSMTENSNRQKFNSARYSDQSKTNYTSRFSFQSYPEICRGGYPQIAEIWRDEPTIFRQGTRFANSLY